VGDHLGIPRAVRFFFCPPVVFFLGGVALAVVLVEQVIRTETYPADVDEGWNSKQRLFRPLVLEETTRQDGIVERT
jgi:hypothetical protein